MSIRRPPIIIRHIVMSLLVSISTILAVATESTFEELTNRHHGNSLGIAHALASKFSLAMVSHAHAVVITPVDITRAMMPLVWRRTSIRGCIGMLLVMRDMAVLRGRSGRIRLGDGTCFT
ncbi:hypothetical protein ACHAWO_000299 [Cyclotella atomus]|uniref:Secreted protein n=1 Tax=Cyclotella atomus TaxID=382360 RepID=A0ABD3PBL4_9STRA